MTTPLPGIVETAAPGPGLDCVHRLTRGEADKFKAAGFSFVVRYVRRDRGVSEPGELKGMTRREAEGVLESGLAMMVVQGAPSYPTVSRGARMGAAAADNARELGFADGCTVFCDIEAVGNASDADIIGFGNAWHAAVLDAGYHPGLYVGVHESKLTGDQLYKRFRFDCYWGSAMNIAAPLPRNYSMMQTRSGPMFGVDIDRNVLTRDEFGGLPSWQILRPC